MSDKMIFNCTYGTENHERATLPFVAANVAATAGLEAVILCTIEGVNLGVRGVAEEVAAHGLPPLAELYREFLDNGGVVWLCGACTKPRGITEDDLAGGTIIVGAAKVIEELAQGAKAVAFG